MKYSPFGKLAPGFAELDIIFKDMFREAEKNKAKYSCTSSHANLTALSLVSMIDMA